MPRRRRALGSLALATATLALGVCAIEGGLRLFRPVHYLAPGGAALNRSWRTMVHRPSSIPGLAYELNPGARSTWMGQPVAINRHGMRDVEPEPAGTPGLARIAVLGDSFTFGFGVAADETYPAVLERLLAQQGDGRRWDVLNFGVGGYCTRDEALALRHRVAAWGPRWVVIGYVLNDPEVVPVQRLHAFYDRPRWWQRWHLLRLVAQARRDAQVRSLGGGDYNRFLHADPDSWGSVLAALDDVAALSRERGFRVLVAIFPLTPKVWSQYAYEDLHVQVSEAARARGLEVLDLLGPLEARPAPDLWVARDDSHPSRTAHTIAALAIRDRILALESGPAASPH